MMLVARQKMGRTHLFGMIGTLAVHIALMSAWLVPAGSERVSSDTPIIMLNLVQMGEPDAPAYRPPVPKLPSVLTSIVVPEFPELDITAEIPELNARKVTGVSGAERGAETYHSSFARHLGGHLKYPVRSKLLNEEGNVLVRILIMRDGALVSADIEKSSGFAALGEEALAVVWRAQPFPPPPIVIPGDLITLFMPIEFHVGKQAVIQEG